MKPNVSRALRGKLQSVLLKEITVTTVDFEPVETIISTVIDAVIQPADMEKVKVSNIDYSKEYLMVHSTYQISMNDVIEWMGSDYVIRARKNYSQYGYTEGVAEEIK